MEANEKTVLFFQTLVEFDDLIWGTYSCFQDLIEQVVIQGPFLGILVVLFDYFGTSFFQLGSSVASVSELVALGLYLNLISVKGVIVWIDPRAFQYWIKTEFDPTADASEVKLCLVGFTSC